MAKKQTMDHAQLLVLSLLAGEDMYGYQMIVELARRSDHTFEMKEGTLYPVLHGLERDGAVYFPDAPTERGVKHLEELMACKAAGYEAAVCFVIQMERADFFSPNDLTPPAFGDALRRARAAGVEILAHTCRVTPDSLTMAEAVEVRL